jgi:ribosomal protein S18 acetylase RimI-like enzyme
MFVRNLEQCDKNAILDLGREIFREEDEIPLLKKALYLCVSELSFVAVEDKNIVGFTLVCKKMTNVYYTFLSKIPDCYELAFLGISPSCQGRGLGTRLLKETLLAIFQTSNQFTCWLLVDTDNTGAIGLYERIGFRHWIDTTTNITPVPGYIMGISYKRFIDNNKLNKYIYCNNLLTLPNIIPSLMI